MSCGLKENARQGFWNGSQPPFGCRTFAAEKRGAKVKKKLEVDPLHAETVPLIFKLALQGNGQSGLMRVKTRRTRDANATRASLKRSGGGSQRTEG